MGRIRSASSRVGREQTLTRPREQEQARMSVLRCGPFPLVLSASALAWGILLLSVPPAQQNFPLSDDWAFGRGAFLFAGGHGIHYSNWASMPQLGQWLWACPFIWLLGASFFSLRLSTIVLSWLGLWAFYDLLRQEKWSPGRAALAASVMAFHPVFFLLQGTFMTDVPALSLALGALAFYVRAMRSQRSTWLIAAVVTAVLAALTRQNTVAVPLIAAFLMFREKKLLARPVWWLSVLIPALIGILVHFWFQGRPDIIPVEPRVLPPPALLLMPYVLVHWCGLTALPLLLLPGRACSWRTVAVAFAVLVLSAGYWFYHGKFISDLDGLFPYTGNMVSPLGAYSGDMYVGERPIVLGKICRALLTLLGCLGGAWFVGRASTWDRPRILSSPLLLFSLSQIIFILIAPALWDRYLLPVAVAGALVLAGTETHPAAEAPGSRRRWAAAVALVAVVGLASVGLMHDWLAWNAALWDLGRRAEAHGVDSLAIEGGLEWDGLHEAPHAKPQRRSWRDLFVPSSIVKKAGKPKGLTLESTRVWFPHVTGDYALSFAPMEAAAVVDSQPYRMWLSSGERRIYLLRCKSPERR